MNNTSIREAQNLGRDVDFWPDKTFANRWRILKAAFSRDISFHVTNCRVNYGGIPVREECLSKCLDRWESGKLPSVVNGTDEHLASPGKPK